MLLWLGRSILLPVLTEVIGFNCRTFIEFDEYNRLTD